MTQEKQPDSRHGYVFNIQRYSLHDGPGIRTLVFLKGCPLRCKWCSNPESQDRAQELAFNARKCIGAGECGYCVKACPEGAIREADNGLVHIDREKCTRCFQCVDACPSKALTLFGKLMSVDEVLEVVETDGIFYARSGGGLT
ncbi:MAG: glycyl-radical enzyme activating protein, partial [Desulfobacteraceae bacterium]|nr:glycyl-radical enzyme activating protein [Desulfobacteraceae bacterium]